MSTNTSYLKYRKFKKELLRQAAAKNVPALGMFELTGRCNFDCKMCYVHTDEHNICSSQELDTEEWKKIFDEAIQEGIMFALLTGGECLLREDFKELYLYLWNKGVFLAVNTNGFLLTDEMLQFFETYPPKKIQVSLYGSNDDTYERVTGRKVFNQVFSSLLKLKQTKIHLHIAITPSRFNKDSCGQLVSLCQENSLPYSINELLIEPRDGLKRESFGLTPEEICSIIVEQKSIERQILEPVPLNSLPCTGCNNSIESHIGVLCNAGRNRYHITWDGKMHPCMAITDISADVLKLGLHDSWKVINSAVLSLLQPSTCTGCAYEKVCPVCPAARLNGLFSKNVRIETCKLTQLKTAAGILKL